MPSLLKEINSETVSTGVPTFTLNECEALHRAIAALKDRSNAVKKAIELREKVSPYPSPIQEALIKSVEADESAAAILDELSYFKKLQEENERLREQLKGCKEIIRIAGGLSRMKLVNVEEFVNAAHADIDAAISTPSAGERLVRRSVLEEIFLTCHDSAYIKHEDARNHISELAKAELERTK